MNIICEILVISILALTNLSSLDLLFRRWQGGTQYAEAGAYPVTEVASNYGPRNYSPKNFHYGI